jgi:sec-independent protein translocase protein TatA
MGNFGVGEWLIILLVILVLFGAKKIPDLAKGIGKGIRDFKKELKDDDEEKPSDKDKKLEK